MQFRLLALGALWQRCNDWSKGASKKSGKGDFLPSIVVFEPMRTYRWVVDGSHFGLEFWRMIVPTATIPTPVIMVAIVLESADAAMPSTITMIPKVLI
jgi:hypothetical protein